MRVTLAQTIPKLNRSNLDDTLGIIKTLQDKSDLIVFPELSLNGYLLQDKLYEDAWELGELKTLIELSTKIDIVVGAAIQENKAFRNAALYISKGKILHQHDKVHLPNYGMFEEARYFMAGNSFESFRTDHGKVFMLVCEDLWHKHVHEKLKREDPDIVIVLVASPARGFSDEGLEIEKKWNEIISEVARECKADLIFVNRVGFEDGLGFWGGSKILDSQGICTHSLELYKETVQTFEIK